MANAAWFYKLEPPLQYVDIVRDVYIADIDAFDTPNEGAERINAWASDKTRGKITEVIKPEVLSGNLAVMVLTNAVYFKGTWVTQFPNADTRESNFWPNSERSVKADFMNVRGDFRLCADRRRTSAQTAVQGRQAINAGIFAFRAGRHIRTGGCGVGRKNAGVATGSNRKRCNRVHAKVQDGIGIQSKRPLGITRHG